MNKPMVLVTGGNGFIGTHCILQLLNEGYSVRTTVRSFKRKDDIITTMKNAGAQSLAKLFFVEADLTQDDGWEKAAEECAYVIHAASPVLGGGADLDSFLIPAREGALRVLRAATKAKVKRVVMTSAAATARPRQNLSQMSEESVWADPEDPQFNNYQKSKILAERAAWDFMNRDGGSTELTTILPGAVLGPILHKDNLRSAQIVGGMLEGTPPAIPKMGLWVVDVRDLASAHIKAMTHPQAGGERFIVSGKFLWMDEIAGILKAKLGNRAAKVSTRRLPTFIVKLFAPFNAKLKFIAPLVGRKFEQSSDKAKAILGFSARSAEETVIDTAESIFKFSK